MSFGNVLGQQTDLSQFATKSEVDSKISTATNDMATQSWVNQQGFAGWTQICQWESVGTQTYNFNNKAPCAFKFVIYDFTHGANSSTLNLLMNGRGILSFKANDYEAQGKYITILQGVSSWTVSGNNQMNGQLTVSDSATFIFYFNTSNEFTISLQGYNAHFSSATLYAMF